MCIDPSLSPEWLTANTNIYVEMVRTPRRVQRSLIFSLWRRWRCCCALPLYLFFHRVYLMCVAFDMIVFSSSCAMLSDHKDNNGGEMCLHTLRSLDFGSSINGPINSKSIFKNWIWTKNFNFIGLTIKRLSLLTSSRSMCAQSETLMIYSGDNE